MGVPAPCGSHTVDFDLWMTLKKKHVKKIPPHKDTCKFHRKSRNKNTNKVLVPDTKQALDNGTYEKAIWNRHIQ